MPIRTATGAFLTAVIDPFDLDAAMLRKSAADIEALMSALAARLEGALPARVKIGWKRESLFSVRRRVSSIALDLEDGVYEISVVRGDVRATLAKKVRGVAISTKALAPTEWLAQVRDHVTALADHAGRASDSLHDFL